MEKKMEWLKLKQEQLKMVEKQGYDITPERSLYSMTPQQFLEIYEPWAQQQGKTLYNSLSYTYEPLDQSRHRLLVYYSDQTNKSAIEGLGREMAKGIRDVILITPEPLTPQAQEIWNRISLRRQRHFIDAELMHDITTHVYVPAHRILSPEEAKTLLTRNRLRPGQMPLLPYEDPQNKYQRAQGGQIIEIMRHEMIPEALVKAYPFYRVVDDPAPD
jgi:DNA-directed RNA polymerase I, II, and III subunit RPABC1